MKNCENCTNYRQSTLLKTYTFSFQIKICQLSQDKEWKCKDNNYNEWQEKKY